MPVHIKAPSIIAAAGNKPKTIAEYFGRVNSKSNEVSIAKMNSPEGWVEPYQTPEFDEYTFVIKGTLKVETNGEEFLVNGSEAILVEKGSRVRYSSPFQGGAEYIAVCLPAFSPDSVHRD